MNTDSPTSKSSSAPFLGPLIGINIAGLFLIVSLVLIIRCTKCCGLHSKRRPVIRISHQVSEIHCSENPRNDVNTQNNISRGNGLESTMTETCFMSPPSYQMSSNNNPSRCGTSSVSSTESSSNSYRTLSITTLQTDLSRANPSREPPPPYREVDY